MCINSPHTKHILVLSILLPALAALLAADPAPTPTAQDKRFASLQIFPKSDDWNRDISKDPVDPNSAVLIAKFGPTKPLHPDWGTHDGIPFQFVNAQTPRITPKFTYADDSDPGPYPIPASPLIEGGPNATGDRHILCLDAANHKLYELFACKQTGPNQWSCGSGAIFDLSKNSATQRA